MKADKVNEHGTIRLPAHAFLRHHLIRSAHLCILQTWQGVQNDPMPPSPAGRIAKHGRAGSRSAGRGTPCGGFGCSLWGSVKLSAGQWGPTFGWGTYAGLALRYGREPGRAITIEEINFWGLPPALTPIIYHSLSFSLGIRGGHH